MTYKQTQKVRRIDQPLESIDVIDPASYEKKMFINYRNNIPNVQEIAMTCTKEVVLWVRSFVQHIIQEYFSPYLMDIKLQGRYIIENNCSVIGRLLPVFSC